MKTDSIWVNQLRCLLPVSLKIYVPTTLALLVLLGVSVATKIPMSLFTRDALESLNAPFYTGLVSHVGWFFWCSTAAICLFSFAVMKNAKNSRFISSFFLLSGIITIILVLDDVFLLHEIVIPEYFYISQKKVYAGYAMIIALYLIRHRKTILKTEFSLMALAFGFFGLSIIIDVFFENVLPQRHLFEDGFKLLGIMSWFIYFARTCHRLMSQALAAAGNTAQYVQKEICESLPHEPNDIKAENYLN